MTTNFDLKLSRRTPRGQSDHELSCRILIRAIPAQHSGRAHAKGIDEVPALCMNILQR